jgi:formylglycine-generating enzyme required for sulfatase activity
MRSMLLAVLLTSAAAFSVHAEGESDKLPKDGPMPLTAPFDEAHAEAAQEAWAKSLGKSSPVEKNSIGMELVLIPAGKFTMGAPDSEKDKGLRNEAQVDVTLTKPFYLGKTEVTQGQWRAVMGTTPWTGQPLVREGESYAATYVSWEDAQTFCRKLSELEKAAYRLPTEAEWEYACRAGTTTRFSFGDDESQLSDYAWWGALYDGNTKGERYAHEVGLKRPNPFGLSDMHGNVWEWCEDVDVSKGKLPGGTDPLVSAGSATKVIRGGDWRHLAAGCRSGLRNGYRHDKGSYVLGFRAVRSSTQ